MTQEDKDLLFKDISQRLPYGVKIDCHVYYFGDDKIERAEIIGLNRNLMAEVKCESYESYNVSLEDISTTIYLRPMSSMTEEERREYDKLIVKCIYDPEAYFFDNYDRLYDWLNSHHFDYRGLIDKSLAIVAPEEMYNYENN